MINWDHEESPQRHRAPRLSDVVETAIALADHDGIEAVSLRRVASNLGASTASFYRVLSDRNELLERMVDVALGRHIPPAPTGDWQASLAAIARNRYVMLSAHPWLGIELAGGPAVGPNALTHHEMALASVASYSNDPAVNSGAAETVLAFAFGASARDMAEIQMERHTGLSTDQWRANTGKYLQDALASGAYPHLDQMVREVPDVDPNSRFEHGLSCILEGLESRRVRNF